MKTIAELEKYLEEVEGKEFLGKSRYVKKIKKEINERKKDRKVG